MALEEVVYSAKFPSSGASKAFKARGTAHLSARYHLRHPPPDMGPPPQEHTAALCCASTHGEGGNGPKAPKNLG